MTLPDLDVDSREYIIWLFRGRCVLCNQPGSDVHEIVPRSRGKASLEWKNKVYICHKDHMNLHEHGVSSIAIKNMQEQRALFLIAIGRGEYV